MQQYRNGEAVMLLPTGKMLTANGFIAIPTSGDLS